MSRRGWRRCGTCGHEGVAMNALTMLAGRLAGEGRAGGTAPSPQPSPPVGAREQPRVVTKGLDRLRDNVVPTCTTVELPLPLKGETVGLPLPLAGEQPCQRL